MVVRHQCLDDFPCFTALLKFSNLRLTEFLGCAETHTTLFRFLNPIHLAFSSEIGLELSNCAQHIEQQASGGMVGINILVDNVEMNLFTLQFIGNLRQMQGRTCQTVKPPDNGQSSGCNQQSIH